MVRLQYEIFESNSRLLKKEMPKNKNITGNTDLILRNVDCAIINSLHKRYEKDTGLKFHSVRGVFTEGEPLYEGAGFNSKSHIQIAIRNPNCIKGYFSPIIK